MTATRTHLLEWVHTLGVGVLQAVFRAEAEAMAGPKGKHQVERTHHHWGCTATELNGTAEPFVYRRRPQRRRKRR
jgi:hypothetical protein